MQSQHEGSLRKLKKRKGAAQHQFILFYKSVAGDPGKVATDWRLLGVQSVEAFPGTAELELTKT